MDKFDPTRGKLAFSYFSSVAKFYLIQKNDGEWKKLKSNDSINKEIDEKGEDSLYLQLPDVVDKESFRSVADFDINIYVSDYDISAKDVSGEVNLRVEHNKYIIFPVGSQEITGTISITE